MESPYLLVDAKNLAYRCFVPDEEFATKDGTRTDIMHVGFKILSKLARTLQPRRIFLVWDDGPSWWRREVFKGYKDKPLDSYMVGTKEEIASQTPAAKEFFSLFGMINLEAAREEADDIIAAMTRVFSPCMIVSSDSDFLQLLRDDVHLYEPKKGATITPETCEVRLSGKNKDGSPKTAAVPPHLYAVFKAIVGDKSDTIPGVKGLGWGTVVKLFKDIPDDCTETSEILTYILDVCKGHKAKRPREILTSWQAVKRNIALIDMRRYPKTPGIDECLEVAKAATPTFYAGASVEAMKRYEMVKLLADLHSWAPVFESLPDVQRVD